VNLVGIGETTAEPTLVLESDGGEPLVLSELHASWSGTLADFYGDVPS
jgi:hypothetical protein